MNEKKSKETLQKAERDLLICFVRGVMLYRIAEEIKKEVFTHWESEDFEAKLHAAMKACDEMRAGVDESVEHLIEIVPEVRAYKEELKVMFNETKEEHEQGNEKK